MPGTEPPPPEKLSSFQGPIVVNLWATRCGPCRATLPDLDGIAHRSPGLPVVALSVDEKMETAAQYLSASQTTFLGFWAVPNAMKQAGVSSIPTTFVLDDDLRPVK